ncbi:MULTISPECIES: hypothetical protein [unclassified Bosea (in: a-proteobacteria)]|uniref:hypothetical protein n=1 Tax=unclassified Bosea (in: a-proteobacteria) TaxID=2653178 RepID=UPI00125F0D23|nr:MULTISPECIES: hypothetical protein [unclassified Bosea (in: a-proteobacteria)]
MVAEPFNKTCFVSDNPADQASITFYNNDARGIAKGPQNGGMSHVQRIHLNVGQYYFRFCDRRRFGEDWKAAASGCWWADYEVFVKVKQAAQRQRTIQRYAKNIRSSRLAYAAKLYFAIPYEWGDCGSLVIARLDVRLDAYKGRGLPAFYNRDPDEADERDGNADYIPIQDPTVSQLYIPGLRGRFDDVFTVIQKGATGGFA